MTNKNNPNVLHVNLSRALSVHTRQDNNNTNSMEDNINNIDDSINIDTNIDINKTWKMLQLSFALTPVAQIYSYSCISITIEYVHL